MVHAGDGCQEVLPPSRSVPTSAEKKDWGAGCHGHQPFSGEGAELIAGISRVIVPHRKQTKANYYSKVVGGLWLISLRVEQQGTGEIAR